MTVFNYMQNVIIIEEQEWYKRLKDMEITVKLTGKHYHTSECYDKKGVGCDCVDCPF